MKVALGLVLASLIALTIYLFRREPPPVERPQIVTVSACAPLYQKLYSEDRLLRVLIAYGYKDARPRRFVGDRYERNAFIDRLTQPCIAATKAACEFQRSEVDADLFTKTIEGRRIEVRIIDSSIGPDDEHNQKSRRQIDKSVRSTEAFLAGLKNFDVIFYSGHSRDGGGPDFFPPRQRGDRGVDYAFYRRNRPGMKALLDELAREKPRARVLGLFSCASSKHFDDEIRRRAPSLSTITTSSLLFYSDAQERMLQTLDTILFESCPEKSLRASWRRFF